MDFYNSKGSTMANQYTEQYIGELTMREPRRFRPQTRMGECPGCLGICEECERLVVVVAQPENTPEPVTDTEADTESDDDTIEEMVVAHMY